MSKLFLLLALLVGLQTSTFKQQQRRYPRVRVAYAETAGSLSALLQQDSLQLASLEIYIRAFKQERQLEVWGRNDRRRAFKHIKTYAFSGFSGMLGPKRQQGDLQIPEGFYYVDRFNPASNFYLSLGINYPNASDKIRGTRGRLGGDIFIHGSNVTIGCIPITNALIKELYVLAVEAKNNGQGRIPVHIFPARLNSANWPQLQQQYAAQPALIGLWKELRPAYLFFETNHLLPRTNVRPNGSYVVNI